MFAVAGAALGAAAGFGIAGTATGALIGAGIGGTIGSSIGGAKAAGDAADIQASAANRATDTQWAQYQQTRKDQMPWLKAGKSALRDLQSKIQAGPGEFIPSEQPGYQFGFNEFVNPFLASQSAKGMRLSGQTLKGLTRYAQDYANTAYDNFLQRYYTSLNPLQSLANVGQTTGAQLGQFGQNTANSVAANTLAAGQAQAAGQIYSANALTQGIQKGVNALGTIAGSPGFSTGFDQGYYGTGLNSGDVLPGQFQGTWSPPSTTAFI